MGEQMRTSTTLVDWLTFMLLLILMCMYFSEIWLLGNPICFSSVVFYEISNSRVKAHEGTVAHLQIVAVKKSYTERVTATCVCRRTFISSWNDAAVGSVG